MCSSDLLALTAVAVSRVETFGLAEGADWHSYDIEATPAGTRFRASPQWRSLGFFEVSLVGEHNVRNVLAAMAVAASVGVDEDRMRTGLREFAGVRRRLEVIGTAAGVTVFDDFAHHPTAVRETLAAVKAAYPGRRVWAVFEPRSASSCRRVFQEAFAEAFAPADETILAPVYRSSLPEDQRLSPERLVHDLEATGRKARSVAAVDDIVTTLGNEAKDGDLVVCMSNGAFGGIHAKVLDALANRAR